MFAATVINNAVTSTNHAIKDPRKSSAQLLHQPDGRNNAITNNKIIFNHSVIFSRNRNDKLQCALNSPSNAFNLNKNGLTQSHQRDVMSRASIMKLQKLQCCRIKNARCPLPRNIRSLRLKDRYHRPDVICLGRNSVT